MAIEEGNYDVLPGAFYARAFIKQYADAVGLNGEELLVEHQSTIPQSEKREVPQVSTGQKHKKQCKNLHHGQLQITCRKS